VLKPGPDVQSDGARFHIVKLILSAELSFFIRQHQVFVNCCPFRFLCVCFPPSDFADPR